MLATAVRLGVTQVVALGTGRVLASLVRRNAAGRLRVHVAAGPEGVERTAAALGVRRG